MIQKKAYIIGLIKMKDAAGYDEYRRLAAVAINQYKVEFLVRGGDYEVLEGNDELNRVVILTFASKADAKAFYHSEAYQTAKVVRQAASESRFILVEGV
jgi:uncharacterized protein (DUF1330 family)